ncbi:hypothetical protein F2Q68_00026514 [Brassica cretica]|uniref:FAS1 domain-containing protein n=1 Tax=Brassica cretica TaxID=69181 RepID=A0A8S9II97_BRACR|nr:hypothetical protein F2Q68_00026514 [Brassica cretica]
MDGVSNLLFSLLLLTASSIITTALPDKTGSGQINSNSVLVALLDSHYTELAELVEKALLLQTLEEAVGQHNITIFAPRNEALERNLDPEFKSFLLQPKNLKSLQTLLMFHILPKRITSPQLSASSVVSHRSLSNDHLHFTTGKVNSAVITKPDDVTRPDGIIHGIERLLIPRSVQEDFNRRRNLRSISAVLPEGAPEVDPRTHRLKKKPAPISKEEVLVTIIDRQAPITYGTVKYLRRIELVKLERSVVLLPAAETVTQNPTAEPDIPWISPIFEVNHHPVAEVMHVLLKSGQSASREEAVEEMKDCRSMKHHWCRSTVMPEYGLSIFYDRLKPISNHKLPEHPWTT